MSKLREILKDREAWHTVVHGIAKYLVTKQQQQAHKEGKNPFSFILGSLVGVLEIQLTQDR